MQIDGRNVSIAINCYHKKHFKKQPVNMQIDCRNVSIAINCYNKKFPADVDGW